MNVSTRGDSDVLEGVMFICTKGCEPKDLVLATAQSLGVLSPSLSTGDRLSWLPGFGNALKANSPFKQVIGDVLVSAPRPCGLGILLFVRPAE